MSSYRRNGREEHHGNRPPHRDDYREQMYDERAAEPREHRSRSTQHSHARSRTPRGHRDAEYSEHRDNDRHGRRTPPSHHHRRGEYRDRDREGYASSGDSRSRSRSPSRNRRRSRSPRLSGPPSRDVMLDGLPAHMSEDDISNELKRFYDTGDLHGVRLIHDKKTKQPRGFGFVRFPSVDAARTFVEQNFPAISLSGNATEDQDQQPVKVRVNYSRDRDDRSRPERTEPDWTCHTCSFVNFAARRVCLKCRSPQDRVTGDAQPQKQPEFTNNGDSDVSPDGTPSQFLLIRGLESSVTEEILAKGVSKMYKPTGQAAESNTKSARKNSKMASTTGDVNLGAREGSLKRVMVVRDRRTDESWRYGFAEFLSVDDAQAALTRFYSFERFTIASKPIDASYIHAGVFVPVFDLANSPEGVTFAASTNPSLRLQYWDENAYVNELVLNDPEEQSAAAEARSKSAPDAAVSVAEKEGLLASDADAKNKKRKADAKDVSKAKKVTPAHLQFWSNRHAELHGLPAKREDAAAEEGSDEDPAPSDTAAAAPAEAPSAGQQSYADPNRKCCLLCARQFKTDAEVNKHERLSKLHADNMQSAELCAKALAKLAKAGIADPSMVAMPDDEPSGYRDRAKERRRAFGSTSAKASKKQQKQASASDSSGDSAAAPSQPSRGAALLGKMGWAAGQGLGAQGEGATAPIAVDKYAAGVGLGAEGGKLGDAAAEAARNTRNDYSDFVERAREKAKERFERMA